MATLKAILFDFDGTLVNSEHTHFLAFQELLKRENVHIDFHHYKTKMTGVPNRGIMEALLPDLSDEKYNAMIDEKEANFRDKASREEIPMIPVSREVLAWAVSKNILVALVTNAVRYNIQTLLPKLGLEKVFYTQVFGEELEFAKPHPLPYLTALEELGVSADEALVFEDSRAGLQSAKDAGLKSIAIGGKYAPEVGQLATFEEEDAVEPVLTLIQQHFTV